MQPYMFPQVSHSAIQDPAPGQVGLESLRRGGFRVCVLGSAGGSAWPSGFNRDAAREQHMRVRDNTTNFAHPEETRCG